MVLSVAEVTEASRANARIRQLALAELEQWYATLDVSDARASITAIREFTPELVAKWGDVAATVAADFYDAGRAAAGVTQPYVTTLAPANVSGAVNQSSWATANLNVAGDPTDVLPRLAQVVDRLVLQQGTDTTWLNVRTDPAKPRWAWVPVGNTCAWCRVRASRGAVFWSEETASSGRHAKCDCVATEVFDGDELPYDEAEFYEQYSRAAAQSAGGDLSSIMAQMRRNGDGH